MLNEQDLKNKIEDLLNQESTIFEQSEKTIKCTVVIGEKVLSGFSPSGNPQFKKKDKPRSFYGLSYQEIKSKILQHLKEIKYE